MQRRIYHCKNPLKNPPIARRICLFGLLHQKQSFGRSKEKEAKGNLFCLEVHKKKWWITREAILDKSKWKSNYFDFYVFFYTIPPLLACPGGEMVDTRDSKSLGSNVVRVRFPLRAPKKIKQLTRKREFLFVENSVKTKKIGGAGPPIYYSIHLLSTFASSASRISSSARKSARRKTTTTRWREVRKGSTRRWATRWADCRMYKPGNKPTDKEDNDQYQRHSHSSYGIGHEKVGCSHHRDDAKRNGHGRKNDKNKDCDRI